MKTKNACFSILAAVAIFSTLPSRAQDPAVNPPAPLPAGVTLSPQSADLVRLAESGVEEQVLIAYVKNAQGKFNLTADAILYLRDEGIPSTVLTEILNHDKALDSGAPAGGTYVYDQRLYQPTSPTLPPPPTTEQVPTPPPADPQVVAPPTTPVAAPAPAPAPAYVSDAPPQVSYFYNDLSPYGTWVNLDGYGWCWQPRVLVVNHEWRPYCDGGHWVWTDSGWFWQSDYSWGWATFHYGRWHYHERAGWVWFPDTVWAPAWVVWRHEGDHCGWAPLPFRAEFDVATGFRFNGVHVAADFDFGLRVGLFTFIAIADFGQHDYVHHRLAPVEVNRIYNHTTVVNNYVVNENHVIVNRGVPREHVEEVTHRKFQTVAVRNEPEHRPGEAVRPAAGTVYRHEIKTPAAPVHMVAQKVDERHPVVQHTAIVPTREDHKSFTPVTLPNHQQPNYRSANETGNNGHPQNNFAPNNNRPNTYTQTQTPPPSQHLARQNQPENQNRYTPPPNNQNTQPPPVRTYPNNFQQQPVTQPTHQVVQPQPQPIPHNPQNRVVAQQNNPDYYPKTFHQLGDGHTPAAPNPAPLPHYQAPPPSPPKQLGGGTLSMPVISSPKQSQDNHGR